MLLAPMAGEDAKLAGINVVHMLTHSAIQSPRPWVHEGLAHFAEALYREKQGGREAALMLLGIHRAAFLENEKEAMTHPQGSTDDALAATFEESYYRSKAAYVWWMLRDMVGESALKQAIRAYKPEEDKDPKYVEKLVEAASKKDLGWFFEDWVHHDRGLPDFHVQSVHLWKNEKGAHMLTVTIENLGNAGAEVSFTVHFADGEVARRLEVRAKSAATTRVEVPGVPTELVINDGSVPESDLANNVFKVEEQE
jgi:aminopeptidase N